MGTEQDLYRRLGLGTVRNLLVSVVWHDRGLESDGVRG